MPKCNLLLFRHYPSYWLSSTIHLCVFQLFIQFLLSKFECWVFDSEQSIRFELVFYWHLVNVKIDFVSTCTSTSTFTYILVIPQSILLNFKRMYDRKTHIIRITYHMIKCRADYGQTRAHNRMDLCGSYSNQIALRMDRMCATENS